MLTISAGHTNSALLHLSTLSVPCTTFSALLSSYGTHFDAWYGMFEDAGSEVLGCTVLCHTRKQFDEGEDFAYFIISACWHFGMHPISAEELPELGEALDFLI